MSKGRSFIISGPSGVGKSTVLKALMEKRKNLYFSVSATTRSPRPGETDGVTSWIVTLSGSGSQRTSFWNMPSLWETATAHPENMYMRLWSKDRM